MVEKISILDGLHKGLGAVAVLHLSSFMENEKLLWFFKKDDKIVYCEAGKPSEAKEVTGPIVVVVDDSRIIGLNHSPSPKKVIFTITNITELPIEHSWDYPVFEVTYEVEREGSLK